MAEAGAPSWDWLDRVEDLDVEAANITAHRHFRFDEWFFRYHFPGAPVVPGVFLVEAMAHALGVLGSVSGRLRSGEWRHFALLTLDQTKFYRVVHAGSTARVEAHVDADEGDILSGRTSVTVDGSLACRARIRLTSTAFEAVKKQQTGDPFGLQTYLRRVLEPSLLASLRIG